MSSIFDAHEHKNERTAAKLIAPELVFQGFIPEDVGDNYQDAEPPEAQRVRKWAKVRYWEESEKFGGKEVLLKRVCALCDAIWSGAWVERHLVIVPQIVGSVGRLHVQDRDSQYTATARCTCSVGTFYCPSSIPMVSRGIESNLKKHHNETRGARL